MLGALAFAVAVCLLIKARQDKELAEVYRREADETLDDVEIRETQLRLRPWRVPGEEENWYGKRK